MNILILKFMSVIVALTARMGQYLLTPRVSLRYIYPGLCAFALTAHNAYGIRVIIKNAKKHYFFYHIHANSIIFATE